MIDIIGGEFRWICRFCRTNYRDEINCIDGWFKNIPIISTIENELLGTIIVIVMIVVVNLLIP